MSIEISTTFRATVLLEPLVELDLPPRRYQSPLLYLPQWLMLLSLPAASAECLCTAACFALLASCLPVAPVLYLDNIHSTGLCPWARVSAPQGGCCLPTAFGLPFSGQL